MDEIQEHITDVPFYRDEIVEGLKAIQAIESLGEALTRFADKNSITRTNYRTIAGTPSTLVADVLEILTTQKNQLTGFNEELKHKLCEQSKTIDKLEKEASELVASLAQATDPWIVVAQKPEVVYVVPPGHEPELRNAKELSRGHWEWLKPHVPSEDLSEVEK